MRWLICFLAVPVVLSFARPSSLPAQEAEASATQKEYTVKAVFLYGFGRYVEWPAKAFGSSSAPFVIGILGEDRLSATLVAIAKRKTIQGRKIEVARFASIDKIRPCHILFVSDSLSSDEQAAVIAKLAGKPVFLVGDMPGFAERGGSADFTSDGEHVGFEINVGAATRSQLQVNSKLLSLAKAKLVGGESGPND
jgi:hypothetical protein